MGMALRPAARSTDSTLARAGFWSAAATTAAVLSPLSLEQRAARPGRADDDPLGTFEQVACGGQGRRQLDPEALLHLGDAAGEAANRNDALRVKGVEEGFVIGRRLGRIEQEDAASARGADAGGKADQLFITEL